MSVLKVHLTEHRVSQRTWVLLELRLPCWNLPETTMRVDLQPDRNGHRFDWEAFQLENQALEKPL